MINTNRHPSFDGSAELCFVLFGVGGLKKPLRWVEKKNTGLVWLNLSVFFRQTSALARSSEILCTFVSAKAETCQSGMSGSSLRRDIFRGKCSAGRGGLKVRMVRAGVMVGGAEGQEPYERWVCVLWGTGDPHFFTFSSEISWHGNVCFKLPPVSVQRKEMMFFQNTRVRVHDTSVASKKSAASK